MWLGGQDGEYGGDRFYVTVAGLENGAVCLPLDTWFDVHVMDR